LDDLDILVFGGVASNCTLCGNEEERREGWNWQSVDYQVAAGRVFGEMFDQGVDCNSILCPVGRNSEKKSPVCSGDDLTVLRK